MTAEKVHIKLVREKVEDTLGIFTKVSEPRDVAKMAHHLLKDEPSEVVVVFLLNTRHVVTGWQEVTRGTIDASLVHPREVLRAAILGNAAAVILAHNHPSGDPSPSPEDRKISEQMKAAADIFGIRFLDHIVIGDGKYQSAMADYGSPQFID
jgi:DNA repair protein RadC